uniref:gap junction gamma-3 protein isoform X2 n=1 Tax=Halichoerus grypus TaxID=9711 RepID=UPI001659F839|nr:gap junction gamma-3 protein isoform X2 [Halichoerus grypus]
MCGRFVRQLLAEESRHSTVVGHLLLPVLLGFRLVLLAASGTGIYGDEQSEFVCHTQQAGCKAACYDTFHPFSPLRFWAFQVILVAVPSALYMGFTLYHLIWHREESGKVKEETLLHQGEKSRDGSGPGSPRLLWAYVAQLGVRLVLEGAALGVQYHLYGFKMPSSFACRREPCLGSITCYLSRPSEKTIFLKTMFGLQRAPKNTRNRLIASQRWKPKSSSEKQSYEATCLTSEGNPMTGSSSTHPVSGDLLP